MIDFDDEDFKERNHRMSIKIEDSDDHTTSMDVVRVPEGFSLQMGYNRREDRPEGFDYISVIVSPQDARRIVEFMRYHDHLGGKHVR